MLDLLAATVPHGWSERRGAVRAAVLRVPRIPPFNRVMAVNAGADPADVAALVERINRDGLPYVVETSPAAAAVDAWCRATGLAPSPPVPLMACAAERIAAPAAPAGVEVDRLPAERLGEHLDAAAAGFEVPREYFAPLDGSTMLADRRVAAVIATVDGEPAATGLSVVAGDWVGVFVVGTLPRHRRRGLGAAVTARLVQDAVGGHEVGWAVLQSSEQGLGVYSRLGFRSVAHWTRWTVAA